MIIGSKRIFLEKVTSTNTLLDQLLAAESLAEGTIIQAGYQTAGKGQKANTWESEEGKNLIFSILLYPSFILPSNQFLISMAVSLGILDYVSRHTDRCTIKWPNDIYVNNDKIAGILIENSLMGNEIKNTIAGIGLNLNQVRFYQAPNPVSLKMLTGIDYDTESSLDQLLSRLDRRYKQLIKVDFLNIRDEYTKHLFRYNEWFQYSDNNGLFKGRIKSVSEEGRLQIERSGGNINEYSFGDIDFIL